MKIHVEMIVFQGMLVSLGEGKAVGSLAAIVGPQRDYYVQGRGAKLLYSSLYRMHQVKLRLIVSV